MIVDSYQHAYGNIYANPTDVFESQYAQGIDSLLPSTTALNDLYAAGRLPRSVLFNSTPPAPEFAAQTPPTAPAGNTPAALVPIFAMGFGTPNLVTNRYRLSYLRDAQAAPDGGFPTLSTGVPATSPANTLRQALKTNDLRNWTATAPVLLCGGNEDPTVFFFNTQLMQAYWMAHAPAASVTVLDVDSPVTSGDPYASLKTAFAAAKTLLSADGGSQAVLQAYHATLVPPVCLSAVKSFFDGFQ
jgi:hypothetical protein